MKNRQSLMFIKSYIKINKRMHCQVAATTCAVPD